MGSKADDRPDGERNCGHLPEEVETTVQEEGGGRGHGACPQCAREPSRSTHDSDRR